MATNRQKRAARDAAAKAQSWPTSDAFANPLANVGKATRNITSADTYALEPITRERALLDFAYRGSWVIGVGIDAVAEDMTREGVSFTGEDDPAVMDILNGGVVDLDLWSAIGDAIKWSRLYGGAIAVMLIDGQDPSTPLDVETIGQGQFKGLYPIERWLLTPTWGNLVTELGPNLGKPEYYQPTIECPVYRGEKVHHSRVIRFDGITMPYYQRVAEWGWGMSIVERVWDRLTAFDSVSQGAAQLVHKAYLRTIKVEGLRSILAAKGPLLEALTANFDMIRSMQTAEGLTVLDSKDDLQTSAYSFAGLSDMVLQFGQQISGAFGIPLVRFFGQSPVGLNSTGESDWEQYDTNIKREQMRKRAVLGRMFDIMYRSEVGRPPPESFGFVFNPLREMSRAEKADIAQKKTATIISAFEAAVIGRKTAMQELKQQADETGVWSNITSEQIDEADEDPPAPDETMGDGGPSPFDPNPLPDSFGPSKELPKGFGGGEPEGGDGELKDTPEGVPFKDAFDPSEPRAPDGKWTAGGGGDEVHFPDDDWEPSEGVLPVAMKRAKIDDLMALHAVKSSKKAKKKTYPSEIQLNRLLATQPGMLPDIVEKHRQTKSDEPIEVDYANGKFYVQNGHHRVVAAGLRKEKSIKATITRWDVKDETDTPASGWFRKPYPEADDPQVEQFAPPKWLEPEK